jgi:RND superfamily putative drug exporter
VGRHGAVDVSVGGDEAVSADITKAVESSLGRAELIAVPLTLVRLLLVFRSVISASLPLLVGVIAIMSTFLTLFVLAPPLNPQERSNHVRSNPRPRRSTRR